MATLRDIKVRMKSVQSVSKITSSMKTVAASRLKQAEKKKDLVRPFYKTVQNIFQPFFPEKENPQQVIQVVITADRGLCGGLNSSIIRRAKAIFKPLNRTTYDVVSIGEKGRAGLMREYGEKISLFATGMGKKPLSFSDISRIADEIIRRPYDALQVFSTKFVNILVSVPIIRWIPGIQTLSDTSSPYEFEGDSKEILNDLYAYHLSSLMYSAIIESSAAELGARMSAMDNATRNAKELIDKLTLEFNRKRQAVITNELIEIISGATNLEKGDVMKD
jgi:ATP synthase F1 gamma subunit